MYVAAVDGTLTALEERCGDPAPPAVCAHPWTDQLGHAVADGPVSTDDVLYIGDDAGTVHAYAIPRG